MDREVHGGGSGSKEQPHTKKKRIDFLVGGEGKEDTEESFVWMLGTELCMTCGDLIKINKLSLYEKSAES